MTPTLRSQFDDYAAHHATPGNKACHGVGIPLIVLSTFALLGKVPLFALGGFTVTAAELLLVAATLYYLTLDRALALLMAVASVVMVAVGRLLGLWPAVAIFVFGWILQFIGHYVYEKRSPAFFRNLTHLLVGPLWILAKATGRS
ncbi:MAG TPA: Mpo1-like protein [Vicinamibacteria bacterium]|nr:Mpo1-like protein [Vicinamibacteria bacterium]